MEETRPAPTFRQMARPVTVDPRINKESHAPATGGARRPYRLAVLFSHPIQYFGPMLREIATRPEMDLTVYFCSDRGITEQMDPGFGTTFKWDVPLLEGYRYQFLHRPALEIAQELRRHRYEVLLITGYTSLASWSAFCAAYLLGIPVLLRGDSHLLDQKPWHKRLLKKIVLTLLLKKLAGALYVGTSNRRSYEFFGVEAQRLFFAPHAVNNAFFRAQAEKLRPEEKQIRRQFGIMDGRPLILFCGKLIPKKQPLRLLEAFSVVRKLIPCALLYVGDGPLRQDLLAAIERADVPDVYVTGFLNQSKISQAYVASDVLVLPSSRDETWGLVINEAMNFGRPVVASDKVGGGHDLIAHGENGYVVPAGDTEALSACLMELVRDPMKRESFGSRSVEIIEKWNYDAVAEGLVSACRTVAGLRE